MKKWILVLLFILIAFCKERVYAAEEETKSMIEELSLEELDSFLQEELPDKMSFEDLVVELAEQGTDGLPYEAICQYFFDMFFYEMAAMKPIFIQIFGITIVFSFMNHLLLAKKDYGKEVNFFVLYGSMMILLFRSFLLITDVVVDGIGTIVAFMNAFVPVFATTLLLSGNTTTSAVFYELTFCLIYFMEFLSLKVWIPATKWFVFLRFFDQVFEESKLSKLSELVQKIIQWGLKGMMGIVLGVGTVQSLLSPAKDRMLTSSLTGLGEVLISCGVLVRNSVGTAALLVLVFLGLSLMVKVCGFFIFYRAVAAVLEPISNKAITESLQAMAVGGELYGRISFQGIVLFFIVIAMVSVSTGYLL